MLIEALVAAASYLLAIVPLITVGVIIAELVIELKWVDRLCFLFSPILRLRTGSGIHKSLNSIDSSANTSER